MFAILFSPLLFPRLLLFVNATVSCTFKLYNKDPETPSMPYSAFTYILTACTPKDKLAEMERKALT